MDHALGRGRLKNCFLKVFYEVAKDLALLRNLTCSTGEAELDQYCRHDQRQQDAVDTKGDEAVALNKAQQCRRRNVGRDEG